MHTVEVFLFNGADSEKLRLARLAHRWTQAQLAAYATEAYQARFPNRRVTPADVSYFERGWRLRIGRAEAILKVLGLETSDA